MAASSDRIINSKNITDDDLKALVSDVAFQPHVVWKLEDVQVTCGTLGLPMATVKLIDANGEGHIACANGTGPVDSAYKAVDHIVKVTQFVSGLFESRNDLSTFKNHIHDFLV